MFKKLNKADNISLNLVDLLHSSLCSNGTSLGSNTVVVHHNHCPCPVFQISDLIIQTSETARQNFFLHTFISHEVPLMFVGPTGTGKSAITNSYLLALPKDQYVVLDSRTIM